MATQEEIDAAQQAYKEANRELIRFEQEPITGLRRLEFKRLIDRDEIAYFRWKELRGY